MFLKTPKFGVQQKAHIFISGLSNPNSFHLLIRDTESNHLKQKKKKKKLIFFDKNTIFDQK